MWCPPGKGLPKGQIPSAHSFMLPTEHGGTTLQTKVHLRHFQLYLCFCRQCTEVGLRCLQEVCWTWAMTLSFLQSFKSYLNSNRVAPSSCSKAIQETWKHGNTLKALFAPLPPERIPPNHPVCHHCRAVLPSVLSTVQHCKQVIWDVRGSTHLHSL